MKKLLTLLLTLCISLGLSAEVVIGTPTGETDWLMPGKKYTSSNCTAIKSGSISLNSDGTKITFDNFVTNEIQTGLVIMNSQNVQIILKGSSSISAVGNTVYAALNFENCGNATIISSDASKKEDGTGSLSVYGKRNGIKVYKTNLTVKDCDMAVNGTFYGSNVGVGSKEGEDIDAKLTVDYASITIADAKLVYDFNEVKLVSSKIKKSQDKIVKWDTETKHFLYLENQELCIGTLTVARENYGLTICGVAVTPKTMKDPMGDGKVIGWDAGSTFCLFFNGVKYTDSRFSSTISITDEMEKDVVLTFNGKNELKNENCPCILAYNKGKFTIQGSGTLYAWCGSLTYPVIMVSEDVSDFIVDGTDGCDIVVQSHEYYAIWAKSQSVTFTQAKLFVTTAFQGRVVSAFRSEVEPKLICSSYGKDYVYDPSQKFIKNKYFDSIAFSVRIYPFIHYNISVFERDVTSANASDVFGDGTVSYDDATSTLTLDNVNRDCSDSDTLNLGFLYFENLSKDLNVVLKGSSIIDNAHYSVYAQCADPSVPVKLTFKSPDDMAPQSITFRQNNQQRVFDVRRPVELVFDRVNMKIQSDAEYAVHTYDTNPIRIISSDLNIVTNNTSATAAAIYCRGGVSLEGCSVTSPLEAVWNDANSTFVKSSSNNNNVKNLTIQTGTCHVYLGSTTSGKVEIQKGVTLTPSNCSFIKSGSISLSEDGKSLYLDNLTTYLLTEGLTLAGADIDVYLTGANTISTSKSEALILYNSPSAQIQSNVKWTETGTATLSLNSQQWAAVRIAGSHLKLSDCGVTVNGCVYGDNDVSGSLNAKVLINYADFTSTSTGCPFVDITQLYLVGSHFVTPADARYSADYRMLVDASGNKVSGGLAIKRTDYNIYIAGTEITGKNRMNVPFSGSGNVSLVDYGDVLQLTLKDVNILPGEGVEGIYIKKQVKQSVKLVLEGKNLIQAQGNNAIYVNNAGYFMISGSGSLAATSSDASQYPDAIWVSSNVTDFVVDNVNSLTANSAEGSGLRIAAPNTIIHNSTIYAHSGNEAKGGFLCASAPVFKECYVYMPDRGVYNAEAGGICFKDSNTPFSHVTIKPCESYGIKVAGVEINEFNSSDVLGDGSRVSYDSQNGILTLETGVLSSSSADGGIMLTEDCTQDVIMLVKGEYNITTTNGPGIINNSKKQLYLMSYDGDNPSKLTLRTSGESGVCFGAMNNSGGILIMNIDIDAETSAYACIANVSSNPFTISCSDVTLKTTSNDFIATSVISSTAPFVLTGCELTSPDNAVWNQEYGLYTLDGNALSFAKDITISRKTASEPTQITIADITDLIDSYLSNDGSITIADITDLIDQYLNQ